MNAEFDILIVIAEAAPEHGQPADMLGGIRYLHAEEELVPVIEVQLIDTYVGKAFIVHKYAVAVDGQRFQQTVMVPVGKPPVRREQSLYICVVPGTCPDADKCISDGQFSLLPGASEESSAEMEIWSILL